MGKQTRFTCKICEQIRDIELKDKYKNKVMCKHCKDKLESEQKAIEEEKVKEQQFYLDLMRILKKTGKQIIISGMIKSQVKKYLEQGYTRTGILLTCDYTIEVLKMDLDIAKYGIGFVAYKYNDCKQYYETKAKNDKVRDSLKDYKVEQKVVKYKTSKREAKKLTYDYN